MIGTKDTSDFDKYIIAQIYINGLFLLEEEEKQISVKINLKNFEDYKKEKCAIFKEIIEENVKKYIIKKIKEKCTNIIEFKKKYNIPVKNIIYSLFINNRIDNIEIIWSGSAIKEFEYVPTTHYLEYQEDMLLLKTHKFKFKSNF
jgi:hypothetical protein